MIAGQLISFSRPDDVNALMSVKLALKYSGRDVEAMKAVAQASKKRSLADFQQVLFPCLLKIGRFLTESLFSFRH